MAFPDEKLNGRELDAAVAVFVMNAPLECRLVGDGKTVDTALRLDVPDAAWRVRSEADDYWERWSPDGAERIVIAPHYSTDVVAAMEVLDKADGMWELSRIVENEVLDDDSTPYVLRYVCRLRFGDNLGSAVADTKEVAICRAALRAVEVHNEMSLVA